MSYCRFSCDDNQSDVYCYESCYGGFVTHVASNRVVYKSELPPEVPFEADHCEAWLARHRQVSDMLAQADRVPIGLPFDGEAFDDATAAEAASRLEWLRAQGYRVPQYAIDQLRAEAGAPDKR